MKITVNTPICICCNKPGTVEVEEREYKAFLAGKLLIQHAMPTTDADVREQLKTGIHPKCWDAMFKEPEDEDGNSTDDFVE